MRGGLRSPMAKFANWFSRLPQPKEPTTNGTLIKCGLVRKSGGGLILVAPDATFRGVRIVEVPASLYDRYLAAQSETADVQKKLASLDYTHRPRASRSRPTPETTE